MTPSAFNRSIGSCCGAELDRPPAAFPGEVPAHGLAHHAEPDESYRLDAHGTHPPPVEGYDEFKIKQRLAGTVQLGKSGNGNRCVTLDPLSNRQAVHGRVCLAAPCMIGQCRAPRHSCLTRSRIFRLDQPSSG